MQVLTCDGQGVVMRQEAWRDETRKQAAVSASKPPGGFARQEKSQRTRMATVAGLSHSDRPLRRPHTVAQPCAPLRLVPSTRQAAPKPVGKKRWASLETPRQTVMAAGCAEGCRRAPAHQAAWVVVVAGDPTPIDAIEQAAKAAGVTVVLMVDILHVLD
jgi:hypothetical protein